EDYKKLLFSRNPQWQRLSADGVFRCEGVPLEFKVPEGMVAAPLAGDRILRLRLQLAADSSTYLVRVFTSSCLLIPPECLLERSVQQLFGSVCAQGQREMQRSTSTLDVLGRPASSMQLEVACDSGERRAYRIVSFEGMDDCHVQVQLFPSSD